VIKELKVGLSSGVDFISNEMLKHSMSEKLINVLTDIFNKMIKYGHVPSEFNTSLLTPIPKKGNEQNTPNDFRPISVSTVFAIIFEKLILKKIDFNSMISENQFGYKSKTSCKNAYFVVNEAISYYNSGDSTLHLASLDATKAFDKLWRDGLFFKLKDKIDPSIWRILVAYYNNSKIIVKVGMEKSEAYRTTEGVKQGGVLSPYLFNFFINEMITNCLDLNIGAKIGDHNISIVSYCDDIVLLSSTTSHLERLLDECQSYASSWKLEFNARKSVYMEMGKYNSNNKIKMAGTRK
jgi:retron-type reverse transcriptase